jgi:hypothetical protein
MSTASTTTSPFGWTQAPRRKTNYPRVSKPRSVRSGGAATAALVTRGSEPGGRGRVDQSWQASNDAGPTSYCTHHGKSARVRLANAHASECD